MHPSPLPDPLGPSFSVRHAREQGVTSRRLRARDLGRPFHGVRERMLADHAPDMTAESDLLRRIYAYATRMGPHEFFSHASAAILWGIPLPAWVIADRAVDVAVHHPRRAPASRGALGHAVLAPLAEVCEHPGLGLRLTDPSTTWAMLGSLLPWRELVAVGDAVVREPMHHSDPEPLATLAQLQSSVEAGRRVGCGRLRLALPHIRTRSRSRPESLLRLACTDAGLPEPELNADIVEAGVWLGQVDLAFRAGRVAVEYEGAHHRVDPVQWARDIERYERLVAAGWSVIRVTNAQLLESPASVTRRIAAALARR